MNWAIGQASDRKPVGCVDLRVAAILSMSSERDIQNIFYLNVVDIMISIRKYFHSKAFLEWKFL